MARIGVCASGTRGDVYPFLAVADALEERGHDVVRVVPPDDGAPQSEDRALLELADTPKRLAILERELRGVELIVCGAFLPAPALYASVHDLPLIPVVIRPADINHVGHVSPRCLPPAKLAILVSSAWFAVPDLSVYPDLRVSGFIAEPLRGSEHDHVVHHGEIGTTAAALIAGRPQLILPRTSDEAFNALQVVRLGAGAALDPKRATDRAIRAMLDQRVLTATTRANANAISRRLAGEDGAHAIVTLIERQLSESARAAPKSKRHRRPSRGSQSRGR